MAMTEPAPDLPASLSDPVVGAKFLEYAALCAGEPEDRLWAAVAEAFDIAGDGRRSVLALERARELNPEWGRHRLQLAKAFLRHQQWGRAIRELDACAELDSSGCDQTFYAENILYYLGYALFGSGQYKEAAEAWRGADNVIEYWKTPEPLKDFHLHRGWAHHLEHDFLGALDAYRRGLISPGPGDCSEDDDMDPVAVEEAQQMNARIEVYYNMAKAGELPEPETLVAVPYTS
jgi:tetratricopeptide (TPR) repeat protein